MLTHACVRQTDDWQSTSPRNDNERRHWRQLSPIDCRRRAGASCMQISRRHRFSAQLYADERRRRPGCLPVRVSRGRHAICASTNFFVVVVVVARSWSIDRRSRDPSPCLPSPSRFCPPRSAVGGVGTEGKCAGPRRAGVWVVAADDVKCLRDGDADERYMRTLSLSLSLSFSVSLSVLI